MERNRDDFTQKVKTEIARRAGYVCSWPGCGKPTEGPTAQSTGAVSIGVASHICAAAPRGPRYDPSQSPEQRSSPENGLWLCQDHAHIVDADVNAYSVDQLRRWKLKHEERVRNGFTSSQPSALSEIAGEHIARGKGNITALDIQGPAIIKPGTRSIAEGEGNITATRIGSPRREGEE